MQGRLHKLLPDADTSAGLAMKLFYLNTGVWLLIGGLSLRRLMIPGAGSLTFWMIAVLIFFNAGGMFVIGIAMRNRFWPVTNIALVFLAVNILLTITDEFGIFDLITLVIDLLLFALVMIVKASYRKGDPLEQVQ